MQAISCFNSHNPNPNFHSPLIHTLSMSENSASRSSSTKASFKFNPKFIFGSHFSFFFTPPLNLLHSCAVSQPNSPLQESIFSPESSDEERFSDEFSGMGSPENDSGNGADLLVVRRPAIESLREDEEAMSSKEDKEKEEGDVSDSSGLDLGLSEIARKVSLFEPERTSEFAERPLPINLELALYRAKILSRNYQYEDAEKVFRQCISFWPEDGRPYVALGKILSKQSRFADARSVYEKGCQATQGENPYIWQCWAVLENKVGNIRKARELFDAATVADKRHVAAWHGWAVLELNQGNIKKARDLLGKGLKYHGGNEYIYQTLALLEAKSNRVEQARYLFRQATLYNPKSCASWLSWAQLEVQQENSEAARKLFEKAVQASPKNRYAWHVWGLFEANQGDIEKGRKLLKIGHALNPRDPVILQSLGLLEYKHSSANVARIMFRRAAELDPRHQPVWIAWGWMEWKEGNISKARELYQKALSIDSISESAARCLQAWGVLEQRNGNLSAARRLFRSSLNINSQSYVTWMTWASLEEQQGNAVRAEEIRNLYFQQRTEVVDDASWVMGFLGIIDPALASIKRLLKFDPNPSPRSLEDVKKLIEMRNSDAMGKSSPPLNLVDGSRGRDERVSKIGDDFDLDSFIKENLSLDALKLDDQLVAFEPKKTKHYRKIFRPERTVANQLMRP
ncbi:hypothetical protein AMTRI_Chr02g263650 [Amborella trichopoda]